MSEAAIRSLVESASDGEIALMLRLIAERVSKSATTTVPSNDADLIRAALEKQPGSAFLFGVREHFEKNGWISPKQRAACERVVLGVPAPGRGTPPPSAAPSHRFEQSAAGGAGGNGDGNGTGFGGFGDDGPIPF